jgi:6-phosphofructokinase 1
MTSRRFIGILTGGGDCPGLNAVIRAVVKAAATRGCDTTGFLDGYTGLVEGRFMALGPPAISGLLHRGGTILGTNNRDNPFCFPVRAGGKITGYRDMSLRVMENLERYNISCLIAIGGDGTLAISRELARLGAPLIAVPKTIDNDIVGTDQAFGFDTAVRTATEALDKLHTTAESHARVMVLELMGRNAGWIALESGLAGGADVILIPEIPWDIQAVARKLLDRKARGKPFSVVVVSEGVKTPEGEAVYREFLEGSHEPFRLGGVGHVVGHLVAQATGMETRVTVLGHIQRGGSPSPLDRVLATRFGVAALELAVEGRYGLMVRMAGGAISAVPLDDTRGIKMVPVDGQLVSSARAIGISFGD